MDCCCQQQSIHDSTVCHLLGTLRGSHAIRQVLHSFPPPSCPRRYSRYLPLVYPRLVSSLPQDSLRNRRCLRSSFWRKRNQHHLELRHCQVSTALLSLDSLALHISRGVTDRYPLSQRTWVSSREEAQFDFRRSTCLALLVRRSSTLEQC